MTAVADMAELVEVLNEIPTVRVISTPADVAEEEQFIREALDEDPEGPPEEPTDRGLWWVKLDIDISRHFAWHVVQELGFVLNYISIEEPLPTVFKPVSSPPYLNGGPDVFLGWVIESTLPDVDPSSIARVLRERLPKPITERRSWRACDEGPCSLRRPRWWPRFGRGS